MKQTTVTTNNNQVSTEIRARLEELRGEIRSECISYGELYELSQLSKFIQSDDVELLQWAGVPEFAETE